MIWPAFWDDLPEQKRAYFLDLYQRNGIADELSGEALACEIWWTEGPGQKKHNAAAKRAITAGSTYRPNWFGRFHNWSKNAVRSAKSRPAHPQTEWDAISHRATPEEIKARDRATEQARQKALERLSQ